MKRNDWAEVFADKTAKSKKGCLEFNGTRNKSGYGSIRFNKQSFSAHRLSWIIANGKRIPRGLCVLHKCDNPPCINPLHLELGDQLKNRHDCQIRGRDFHVNRTHCINGHIFDRQNTAYKKCSRGIYRSCRICNKANTHKWYAKNKPEHHAHPNRIKCAQKNGMNGGRPRDKKNLKNEYMIHVKIKQPHQTIKEE